MRIEFDPEFGMDLDMLPLEKVKEYTIITSLDDFQEVSVAVHEFTDMIELEIKKGEFGRKQAEQVRKLIATLENALACVAFALEEASSI